MVEYISKVTEIIRKDPNLESFMTSAGGGFGSTATQSRLWIQLKPRRQRALALPEVMNELLPKLSGFPGFRAFLTAPPSIRIGGHMTKSSYDFTVQGPDTEELYKQASRLEKEVAKLPGLLDVTTDLQIKNPQVNIAIDRDRAAVLGLNATQIEGALYSAFGPRWTSTIYAPPNQFKVLLGISPKKNAYPDYLSTIYFTSLYRYHL